MTLVGAILSYILYFFLLCLVARLVMGWVQMFARSWQPRGIVLVLAESAYTITDPPLKLLRRFIPPLRLGSVAFDLSFLVLFIVVWVLINIVTRL